MTGRLALGGRVLAVVAHPDDESFGLGAAIGALNRLGSSTALLCFTHGEASSLRGVGGDLRGVRQRELNQAAATLGVNDVRLLDYPDGKLDVMSLDTLRIDAEAMIKRSHADMLLVFDEGGITGHPDHKRATEAAIAAAGEDLPVVAWAIPEDVAAVLNLEFSAAFCGRSSTELDVRLPVDRATQRRAIACHVSQATDNPVLWRRLELLGDTEWLRILNRHGS